MATAKSTKKPASAALQVVPKKSTAVVDIKAALKAQTAGLTDRIAPPTGSSIRITQDKQFLLPDGRKSPGPIDVVIVEFNSQNMFYERSFDPKNIAPPICFAIGPNPKELTPSDKSPVKQSDSCAGCPMNEFGSDGDGKACKNSRVLAVLPPDADETTPLWILKVSPTALKGFDAYVASVAGAFDVPPIGVVTEVSFDPSVTYAKLLFGNPRPNENIETMFHRQDEARRMLAVEPDTSGYEKAQVGKKAPARRR